MSRRTVAASVAFASLLGLASLRAHADPYELTVSGTVWHAYQQPGAPALPVPAAVGDSFQLILKFDSDAPPSDNDDPRYASYYSAISEATVVINGQAHALSIDLEAPNAGEIYVANDADMDVDVYADAITAWVYSNTSPPLPIREVVYLDLWEIAGPTPPTVLSSSALDFTNVMGFTSQTGMAYQLYDGNKVTSVAATVTSATLAPLPPSP